MDGQVETFFLTVVTGALLGLVFDFYRILRGLLRPPWPVTAAADLVYWLLATVMVFVALLFGNWGELRLYVFVGLAAGVLGYYRLFSRQAIRLLVGLLRLTAKAARMVRAVVALVVVRPLAVLARLAAWPFRRLAARIAARRKPPDDIGPPG